MQIGVIHIIHSLNIGGAENVLYSYAKYYNKTKYYLEVCSFKPGGVLTRELENLNIKVHCINTSSSNIRSLIRLAKIFSEGKFTIAHFHNPLPIFWGFPAAAMSGVPIRVLTEHSIDYSGRIGKASFFYRKIRNNMDFIIACSDEVMKSHIPKIEHNRICVIHNGVDTKTFINKKTNYDLRSELKISKGQFIIGNIGNLSIQKGHGILIEAMKDLIKKGVPVVLIIVGDGPMREDLEKKTDESGIRGHVFFLGKRADVPDILNNIDIIAVSSLREGFSISILEAMATSKPIVATNVGGNKELVIDGVTGILVPPGDPYSLSEAIHKLITDIKTRETMGISAREYVEKRFSVLDMVRKTEELYENLINAKRTDNNSIK
jgi:glycosyltransferase involved in cell wall biosynthesis